MRIVTLNAAEMKSFNRRRILEHLRTQSTSRAELSRMTGLTRSAISLIVDGLLREEILLEGSEQGGRVGRKSVSLVINSLAFYSIGLTISRDSYEIGLVDFSGKIHKWVSDTFDPDIPALDTLECISSHIEQLLAAHSLPGRFLGMGITAPGPLDANCGMILTHRNFGNWSNLRIVEFFSNRIPGTILLENNANALALAEKTYCMKGEYDSFLELVVDTGIGAGLIISGDLYKGETGFCNEFGHTSINMNGPRCSCGNFGCAELYASIPNLLAAVQKKNPYLKSWKQVVEMASEKNEDACAVLEEEAEYLASIIVNAINILDLAAVVLTGDIAYHARELNNIISSKVNERFIARGTKQIKILSSGLEEHPVTIASANLVLEHFVKIGE